MVDRVRPLKLEDAGTGGTQTDQFPTSVNPNEDYLDARGLALQNASSADDTVRIGRDASNNITFTDPVAGTYTLTDLTAGGGVSETAHKSLLQLIHFIPEGPAEGFATGATRTTTGTTFPSQILWRRADSTKLVEKNVTYTGAFPTTIEWKIYAADGSTVLATVTDTVTYSGPFETNRTRAIA